MTDERLDSLVLGYTGPAEPVGQVGHLSYHFLVARAENDVYYDFIGDIIVN